MTPAEQLNKIVTQARLAKLSKRYGDASVLFSHAAGIATPKDASSFRIRAAACKYLDLSQMNMNRKRGSIAPLIGTGVEPEISARIDLAMALMSEVAFGHARTLLAEARALIKARWKPELGPLEVKARQQHGLCTYKDVDLPPGDRFDEALKILDATDELAIDGVVNLRTTSDAETLGIAGAVCKAMWNHSSQRRDLENSLRFYDRGYHAGLATDHTGITAYNGYTAINVAYILDLLASLEQDDLGSADRSSEQLRSRAQKIRLEILDTLPRLADDKTNWWYIATLAEAEFGLGQFEAAAVRLEAARKANQVEDWKFESTARQLASLLDVMPGDGTSRNAARQAFSQGFDISPDAAAILLVGKFGLALSGGGFRASLFHIGVLARLAELDMLRHIEVLSCVSGGSIIGAYYYLEVRELFRTKKPDEITRDDYIIIIERIAREFLAGVQTNVRMRMIGSFLGNIRMIWSKLSRTERIGELFEQKIYARVKDKDQERVLKNLKITPNGREVVNGVPFQPKHHNWRLEAKVPILILNATALNTGHNWQFTTTFMGESPLAIDPEVDGNNRLRRLYYEDAPTDELKELRLARAVGASACVPILFEPIALRGLYPGKTVRLVDGGVHDNQGIVGLLEQDCTVMLVSDASGHVGVEDDSSSSAPGVAVRSNDLLMARMRGAQYRDLKARLRSRVLRGLMFLHLRKNLDVAPIDWVGCNDPSPATTPQLATSFGICKDVQEKLAAIRTDLDSFGEAEAFALMTSGYCMTDKVFPESVGKLLKTDSARIEWNFQQIQGLLTYPCTGSQAKRDDLLKVLDAGRHVFFKVFHLHPALMHAMRGVPFVLALMLIGLIYVVWRFPSYQLLTTGTAAMWAIPVLLGLLSVGWLTPFILPGQAVLKLFRNLGIAVFGWLVARMYLSVFDPWYLERSRDYRRSSRGPKRLLIHQAASIMDEQPAGGGPGPSA